ncbi:MULTISPECIES: discoidin domain-containing protein [Chryseobacterium]|uniref:F5/8 type C domain-containing protein n=1 Tax=Chryseobacterium geocarposphaerae TaxID=1416776 RepID=A0ABU1LCT1_9FLAO|nr:MULTISPECIES: discoidin domain-containing protein [Chryseobacterium]MDR6404509.1 hypothetical protein [Chryseobacterium geocarposphaerae]MDR6698259.1 hypothetical protein [Chryseobacterium ginsenosidimutans]
MRKKNIFYTFGVLLLLLLTGCREESFENGSESLPKNSQINAKTTSGIYESDYPYNLNVVYFIPSDVTARPEYQRRVSEFMLAAQEYYRQNMYNWGYGNRTFGLLKDIPTNRVKINVVYGSKPVASYRYTAGSDILAEVNAWFAAHPADKTSDHTIIFTATPSLSTEIPFYGLGRNCFVGDNEGNDYQYFNQNNAQGNQAKAYMGGFLHELGHGIGLPHDALPKSQQNLPGYGTSLMSWGNQTYGYSSTILTKSAAAILNNCQLFSTTAKPAGYFYNQNHDFQVALTDFKVENGQIKVWGNYTVGSPANTINIYFIPKGAYYHAVSGVATNTGNNSFYAGINISDLYFTDKDYELVVQAQFVDGGVAYEIYDISFKNGIPQPQLSLSRRLWAVSTSSQYPTFPASLAIDGDINTYWHSNYTAGSVQTSPIAGQPQNFPYFFDIDTNQVAPVSGVWFVQHQQLVRTAKSFAIWTRNNTTEGWKLRYASNLSNTTEKQYIPFDVTENARFIRIRFDNSYDGQPYVAIPEIGTFLN